MTPFHRQHEWQRHHLQTAAAKTSAAETSGSSFAPPSRIEVACQIAVELRHTLPDNRVDRTDRVGHWSFRFSCARFRRRGCAPFENLAVENDAAADAGAEREQHQAANFLARADPALAKAAALASF